MFPFRLTAVGLLSCAIACGGPRVPEVPMIDVQPGMSPGDTEEAVSVTHPPPAALPEVVSPRPSDKAAWVDGFWNWQQSTWVWRRGGWVELNSGERLRPSRFWYGQDGVLYFVAEEWRDENDVVVKPPEIIAPAGTPPTPMLAEEATVP